MDAGSFAVKVSNFIGKSFSYLKKNGSSMLHTEGEGESTATAEASFPHSEGALFPAPRSHGPRVLAALGNEAPKAAWVVDKECDLPFEGHEMNS